jgi:DNA polymerase (family 10)
MNARRVERKVEMNNASVAQILGQIADLLDFKGENPFRVNSYRKAARAIRELRASVSDLAGRGELQNIPGVGQAIAEKIQEYMTTGKIQAHDELVSQFPPTLPRLLEIPGLGPRKVAILYERLKVGSVDDLRAAIQSGAIEQLAGFGRKTADKLLEGIEFLAESSQRTILAEAWPIAENVRAGVLELPGVRRVEVAGSLRRGCETIGDIDLLCDAPGGAAVIQGFTKSPLASSVRAAGDTKGSILVAKPRGGEIQVDLRVVPAESFGAAWQYFTGSKEHNVRLRQRAIERGWRLNEYGLFDGQRMVAGREEADIYQALGFEYFPPELREDRGEIEKAGASAELVCRTDIRGDLHMHTDASDGRATLEEMVDAAQSLGYEYIAITDHSRSSAIAGGLSIEALLAHTARVRETNEKLKGITLLAGTECDILSDGSLDYPDEVLAQLDWVVASIHAAQSQDRAQLMKRTIAALENPHVCVLGHPSGRLLGKRDAMDLDWEEVVRVAARTGTALEVNSSYKRLDLKDLHVRMAMDAGCWITIDTDAHSLSELGYMSLGVQTARRGWAQRDRVLNTFDTVKLQSWIKSKRQRHDLRGAG